MQPVQNCIDLVDAAANQRAEQRRHVGIRVEHHRNEELVLLDARVKQGADLRLHPAAFRRMPGKHHDPGVGLLQPVIDAGDEVVAGADLPLVEPGIDAARAQRPRQRLDGRLVLG